MAETPTEISTEGYADIDIGAKCAAWGFIEFQNGSDAKIIRIPTSDTRVTRTVLDTKKVTYSVALAGSDTDIAGQLPVTFAKALFKKVDSDAAASMGTDAFSATATLASSGDTLTVTVTAGVLT